MAADNPKVIPLGTYRRREIVTGPGDAFLECTTEGSPPTVKVVLVLKIDGELVRYPIGSFAPE